MDGPPFLLSGNQLLCNNYNIRNHGRSEQTLRNIPVYINDAEQPIGFVRVPSNGAEQSNVQIALENLNPDLENSILLSSGQEKSYESTQRNNEYEDVKPLVGLVPASSGDTFTVVSEYSNNVSSASGTCSGSNAREELGSCRVMVIQASQPEGSPEFPCDKNGNKSVRHISSTYVNSGMLRSSKELNDNLENTILPSNGQEKSFEFSPRNNERGDVKLLAGLAPASCGNPFRVIPEYCDNVSSEDESNAEVECEGYSAAQASQPEGFRELACGKNGYSNVPHVLSSSFNSDMLSSSEHEIQPSNRPEEYEFIPRNSEIEDVKPPVNVAPECSNFEPECHNPPHADEQSSETEFSNNANERFCASESGSESSIGSENSAEVTMSYNEAEEMEISVYFDPECSRSADVFSSQNEASNGRNCGGELEIYRDTVPAQASQSGGSPDLLCSENDFDSVNHSSSSPSDSGMAISSDVTTVHDPKVNSFQHQAVTDTICSLVSNSQAPNSSNSSSTQTVSRSRNICPFCQKWFCRTDNLNRHILAVHMSVKPFKCQICPKEFAAEFDLNRHVERHKKLTCPYCTKVFHRGRSLLKHAVFQHKDKDLSSLSICAFQRNALPCSTPGHFRCSFCFVEFDSLRACLEHCVCTHFFKECWVCQRLFEKDTQLKRHIKTHTGERTFPCNHCDKSFYTDAERRMHLHRLTLEKSFKCSVCDRGFKMQAQLNRHVLTHSNNKPYQCTICTKTFKCEKAYQIHVCLHTGEMPFECQYCDQGFRSWRARQSHQKKDHPDLVTKKEYICSYCSKSYSNSSSFASHVKRHTGQVLRCEFCSFVTVSKENLEIHVNKHTGEKPYKCCYCPMAYGQPNRLTIHERTHTGEKPYACDQCDKAFVDKYSLVRHVRTHTGEKPYNCSYCDKAFAQGCQLQFHERTHTGEKPYECSQCEKKFTRRQELNRHLETHKKGQQEDKSKKKVVEKLETHQTRQQLIKNIRKRKTAESDSDSEFSEGEVEDLLQNRGERLSSLRSAKKNTCHKQ